MTLAIFAGRAALAILAPFSVITAFMALAPGFFAHHISAIGNVATGVGVLTLWPRAFRSIWLVGVAAYILTMWFALGLWIMFGAGPWFPEAIKGLHIDL